MRSKNLSDSERLQRLKEPIIEKCKIGGTKPCSRIDDQVVGMQEIMGGVPTPLIIQYCKSYAFPSAKWRNGVCNMADHIEFEVVKKEKVRVGQQKQKKK